MAQIYEKTTNIAKTTIKGWEKSFMVDGISFYMGKNSENIPYLMEQMAIIIDNAYKKGKLDSQKEIKKVLGL